MKHLLLTTAIIAAGATGAAYAETNATKAENASSAFMTETKDGQIHASDFIGMNVYAAANSGKMTDSEGASADWEDIGEINDVIMTREGQVEAVLVDIGGFLGLGERQVAVNLDEVKFVSDSSTEEAEDFFLVLNADPATLEDAPEYGSNMSDDMSENMDTAEAEVEETAEEAGDSIAMAANEANAEMEEAGDDMAAAADNAGDEIEEGAEDMAQAAENTGEQIEEGAEDLAQSAEATGEEIENDAEAMANEATDGDSMMTAENDAEATEPMTGSTAMTETDNSMMGTPVEESYLTAENLDGARVYDANDEWVGEISELVIAEDGQITDAIVDVGGFLGLGEKPVALKLTDLQILRQDGGDDVRIYTAMAEEELEAMPEFEKQ